MNTMMPTALRFFVAIISLLTACAPELETPTWKPMDYKGFLYELEHPTGELIEDDPNTTGTLIEKQLAASILGTSGWLDELVAIHRQLMPAIEVLAESKAGSPEPIEQTGQDTLHGTRVYARLSCTGPDAAHPATDFSYGTITIEGPQFSIAESVESMAFSLEGHALLEFEKCHDEEDRVLSGSAPGYLSDYYDHVAIDAALVVSGDNDTYPFNRRILVTEERITTVVKVKPHGRYTVSVFPEDSDTYEVAFDGGAFTCTTVPGAGANCDAVH